MTRLFKLRPLAARMAGEHRGAVHDAYLMRVGEHLSTRRTCVLDMEFMRASREASGGGPDRRSLRHSKSGRGHSSCR